jgi:hypothetical protein
VVFVVFHFIIYKDQSHTNRIHYLQLCPTKHVYYHLKCRSSIFHGAMETKQMKGWQL